MSDEPVRFHSIVELGGKTATGIQVPEEAIQALGAGKRPPMNVTVDGYTYRTTVAVMGGLYYIGLNAENRAARVLGQPPGTG